MYGTVLGFVCNIKTSNEQYYCSEALIVLSLLILEELFFLFKIPSKLRRDGKEISGKDIVPFKHFS